MIDTHLGESCTPPPPSPTTTNTQTQTQTQTDRQTDRQTHTHTHTHTRTHTDTDTQTHTHTHTHTHTRAHQPRKRAAAMNILERKKKKTKKTKQQEQRTILTPLSFQASALAHHSPSPSEDVALQTCQAVPALPADDSPTLTRPVSKRIHFDEGVSTGSNSLSFFQCYHTVKNTHSRTQSTSKIFSAKF